MSAQVLGINQPNRNIRVYGGRRLETNSSDQASMDESFKKVDHNKLAYAYGKKEEYHSALRHYYLAIEESKKNPNINVTHSYEYIGHIMCIMENYRGGLSNYKSMLNTLDLDSKDKSNRLKIGCAYKNIGYAHQSLKEIDNALYYYEKALNEIIEDEDNKDNWDELESYIYKKSIKIYEDNHIHNENLVFKDDELNKNYQELKRNETKRTSEP